MHTYIHKHIHTYMYFRSLGVILYFMLCGFHPFDDAKYPVMFNNIKKGRFTYPSPFWDNISVGARDLISVSGPHVSPVVCVCVCVCMFRFPVTYLISMSKLHKFPVKCIYLFLKCMYIYACVCVCVCNIYYKQ